MISIEAKPRQVLSAKGSQNADEIALQRCAVGRDKPCNRQSVPNGYANLSNETVLYRTHCRGAFAGGRNLQHAGDGNPALCHGGFRKASSDIAVKANRLREHQ